MKHVWALKGTSSAVLVGLTLALAGCGGGTELHCSGSSHCAGRDNESMAKDGAPSSTPAGAPAPSLSETAAKGSAESSPSPLKPQAVGDLNFTGASWVQGTWSLGGRKYAKSLAWPGPCDRDSQVVIQLPGEYQRFTATVGFDEDTNVMGLYRDEPATFEVFADRDADGERDLGEEVASRGAMWDTPATIDAPLRGAEQIILRIDTGACDGRLVWGTPEVR